MTEKKMNMLMIIPDDIPIGVIESQMMGLYSFYSKDYFVELAIPSIYKQDFSLNDENISFYSSYDDLKVMTKRKDIVYFRSVINFIHLVLFCKKCKVRMLYDYRGLASFETFSKDRKLLKFLALYLAEYLVYLFADELQCVSKNMNKYLQKIYGAKRIRVIPCLAQSNTLRDGTVNNPIRFVYIGGISEWQNIKMIISTAELIQEHINSEFTFITSNPAAIKEMLEKSHLNNAKVLSGDNEFVLRSLQNQDYGFLFRDDTIFNKIASPIKFLEYTSNGVIPIVTPFVGDYSKEVTLYDIGIVYNNNSSVLINELKSISKKIEYYRERLYRYSEKYTWDAY